MHKLLPTIILGAFLGAHLPAFAQQPAAAPAKPAASAAAAKPAASAAKKDDAKKDEKKAETKKKEKKGGC